MGRRHLSRCRECLIGGVAGRVSGWGSAEEGGGARRGTGWVGEAGSGLALIWGGVEAGGAGWGGLPCRHRRG